MLYHRNSFRQRILVPLREIRERRRYTREDINRLYDANSQDMAAPHTDYFTMRQIRELFRQFSSINTIDQQNAETLVLPRKLIKLARLVRIPAPYYIERSYLLNNIGRLMGLDLYIIAQK